MKIDKEFLKKHRFWIMLGTAVLFWLVSLVVVLIGPAAKAAKEREAFDKKQKEFSQQRQLFNEEFNKPWIERKDFFSDHKNRVWEEAAKTQSDVMTWPGRMAEEMKTASFGDPIKSDSIQRYKLTDYASQFKSLDAFLALKGGETPYFPITAMAPALGQREWKDDPSVEECWLAQEEIWVRREVFNILTDTLRSIGTFKEVREPLQTNALLGLAGGALSSTTDNLAEYDQLAWARDHARGRDAVRDKERLTKLEQGSTLRQELFRDPKELREKALPEGIVKRKLFRSHSWEVELMLEREANVNRLQISAKSTIKNIDPNSRTMPLMNGGKGLLLRINQKSLSRELTRIVGQLVPPGGSATFGQPTQVGAEFDLTGDFQLEEVFELATSPIKVLESITVGKEAQPHLYSVRYVLTENPRVSPEDKPAEGTAGGQMGGAGQMGNMGGGGGGYMGGGGGGYMGGGGMGGMGGGAPPGAMGMMGGGPPGASASTYKEDTPQGMHRKRYTLVNKQVRRLPVAFVVVIDQAHRGDLLTAVANSPLRMQIGQVYWKHRGPIQTTVAARPDKPDNKPGSAPPAGPPGGASGGIGTGYFPPAFSGPPGGSGSGASGNPPRDNPPMGGRPMGETRTGVDSTSLSETNRNLIEMTVHGLTTMFERFVPPPPPQAPTTPGGPSGPGPMGPGPMGQGGPMPMPMR